MRYDEWPRDRQGESGGANGLMGTVLHDSAARNQGIPNVKGKLLTFCVGNETET